ncbi:MAG: hypothetical protein KAH56_12420 [Candidatus Krumholzibacteria bacterium]|nr:hypothetical protein [Candidatus Krumholzibacteria bacterium]
MNTIGQNQGIQPTGPGVQVQEQKPHLQPDTGKPITTTEESPARDALRDSGVQVKTPAPSDGKQYLDPEQMREFVTKVSEAIRKASVEPHLVGFKPDPDSRGYLIEIRKPDGTLVTSFAPEKVLNLHGNMDDLSGMVIDLKT